MTYTAEQLERQFKDLGRTRKSKEYNNDAGYWTGGKCNWGGFHSLKEDCQILAQSFNKMESLREIKDELKKCTNKSEYDAKKANYIRKCEELINGLQAKTGVGSSMFSICIIWSYEAMNKHVISKLEVNRKSLTNLKEQLEKEGYRWVEEIKLLKLEEKNIENRMKENKEKAIKETNPAQKALLLQMIEDDGKKLEEIYKKFKKLSNKFNFDPSKKINDLIKSIKDAIEKRGKNKPLRNPADSNTSDSETDNNSDEETILPNNNSTSENFFQNNQSLIVFAGIATLLILYFYYSQEEEPNYYDF